jgi:GT2 family glycosyltransferase
MLMNNFCFVILHYQTKNDTIGCINSILSNISSSGVRIIVVDNGSPNGSGIELKKQYEGNNIVDFVLSEENLGFTSGNNLGFSRAKHTYDAEFIALINNDTIIEQNDFVDKIRQKFTALPFHLLGPDIVTISGKHQNPVFNKLSSSAAIDKYLSHYRKVLFLNWMGLDTILEKIKKTIIPGTGIHITKIKNDLDHFTEQLGVTLHGSALIFSRLYIQMYEGLYPGPFMYGEEAILDYISKRDNLVTIYWPEVKIIHKDDSSTNSVYRKALRKRRFYLRNFLKTLKVLRQLMKGE